MSVENYTGNLIILSFHYKGSAGVGKTYLSKLFIKKQNNIHGIIEFNCSSVDEFKHDIFTSHGIDQQKDPVEMLKDLKDILVECLPNGTAKKWAILFDDLWFAIEISCRLIDWLTKISERTVEPLPFLFIVTTQYEPGVLKTDPNLCHKIQPFTREEVTSMLSEFQLSQVLIDELIAHITPLPLAFATFRRALCENKKVSGFTIN